MSKEQKRPNWIVWATAPLMATTLAYVGAYALTVDPGPILIGGIVDYPVRRPATYFSDLPPIDRHLRKHEDFWQQFFAPINWVDCKARPGTWYHDRP